MTVILGSTLLWQGEGTIQADIWFVHGLRGDSLKTWTQGDVCWPRDLLRHDIVSSRIYTWGYDSSVLKATKHSSQASIFGHSENLLNDIADTRDDITRPLIFVCHSLGGLVVKEALIRSSEHLHNKQDPEIGAIYGSCKGVVFLGTPHRGSAKTSLGEIASHVAKFALQNPNDKLVNALKEDSDVLERQRRSFATIADKIPLACVYEELPTAIGLIVPEHSASIDGRNVRIVSVPADHMGMCKFHDRGEIGYRRVTRFIKSFIREAVEMIEKAASEQMQKQINELFESLRFDEMHGREDQIEEAHQETYHWLFDERDDVEKTVRQEQLKFRDWLSSDASLLWVGGKPASGKSTLMKYVYNHIQTKELLSKWASGANPTMAGFFFLERSPSMLQKSREGLLRALNYQLLRQLPDHMRFDVLGQFVPKLQMRGVSLQSHSWPLQDLEHLLDTVLRQASPELKMFLLIDGLDEYRSLADPTNFRYSSLDDDERSSRGNKIRLGHIDLAESIVKMASIPHVKICVSSRPLNAFRHEFEPHVFVKLENLTRDDISNYVNSKLSSRERFLLFYKQSPSHKKEAKVSEITKRACGVFLWVRLVLDSILIAIDDYSLDNIQTILNRTPTELRGQDGLYMKMLQNLDPANLARGTRLFRVLIHAMHDLSIFGLWCVDNAGLPGASLGGTGPYMDFDEILQHEREMRGRLASCTAGLLETVPMAQERDHCCDYMQKTSHELVQFIHQSVKEFLEDHLYNTGFLKNREGLEDDHYVNLLRGGVSQLAYLGVNFQYQCSHCTPFVYKPVVRLFKYARYAERSTQLPMLFHLRCLDLVVSKALKCWEPPHHLRHIWGKERHMFMELAKEHNHHWAALLCENREYVDAMFCMWQHRDDFHSLLIQADLVLSLQAEFEQGYQLEQKQGRPLLDYALDCRAAGIDAHSLLGYPGIHMVELLLEHGADVNARYMSLLDYGKYNERLRELLNDDENCGNAPLATSVPDCEDIDTIWVRHLYTACYKSMSDILYDDEYLPAETWIDISQLLLEHGASITVTIPSPVKIVDAEAGDSKGEGLSWPCFLSALFVAVLVSYDRHGAEDSLINLLYEKGARLIEGEKELLKEALQIEDETLSGWIPEVYESTEVENEEDEHSEDQSEVGKGSEDCMEGSSSQTIPSRGEIQAVHHFSDSKDPGYEHSNGSTNLPVHESRSQTQPPYHLPDFRTGPTASGSSRLYRQVTESWTRDLARGTTNKRGRYS